ncbi:hypothetical protein [Demequina sp.]|uniref:hypothetical protein n=1 Tax=Demequina sp. TaxID=2050685 RepID=UPI003D123F41
MSGLSSASFDGAWMYTRLLSPRPSVRIAERDESGAVAPDNAYPRARRLASPAPDVPWTVFLANADLEYALLGFDFDARGDAAAAAADAWAFVALLERTGHLPFVLCESSSSGGRHVWLRPSAPLPAATVKEIADLAKRVYPTLDKAPLSNPRTGALRPPGSPHRNGSVSTVLLGDLADLQQPSAELASIYELLRALQELAPGGAADVPAEHSTAITPLDDDGRRYLTGGRVKLGATAQGALSTPHTPSTDASHALWQVLLGAARARWRYDDVLALLPTAPGLEHARTQRVAGGRRPRSTDEARTVLARHWDRAVSYAASTTLEKARSDTSDLDERVAITTTIVASAIAHADASPGRWSINPLDPNARRDSKRVTDRLVLDELHRRALDGLSAEISSSVRTLALQLTVGRESVRQALHRLATDGWIALVESAHDAQASTWSIDPRGVFHSRAFDAWSRGGKAPLSSEHIRANRAALLASLDSKRSAATHDLFTAHGLGAQAGRLYAHMAVSPTSSALECAGMSPTDALAALEALQAAGVVRRREKRWEVRGVHALDRAAALHGVAGTLDARRHRYRLEQLTWSYWLAERAQLTENWLVRAQRPRVASTPSTTALQLAPYPRDATGRPSWRLAIARVEECRSA